VWKSRAKKPLKRVLGLPDLEQAEAAVLNSLTSASGQRTFDPAANSIRFSSLLGHVSIQTTERYLDSKQKLRCAVNEAMSLEPEP
jgi:hypothetical protein